MTEQEVNRIISLTRYGAKFTSVSHTDDFLDLEAAIGKGFYYVSLYDESINSTLTETDNGVLLIGNTYLSSFAYNLILAWRFELDRENLTEKDINPLIKHNFKKFFAEQLIYKYNNTFSRAIFLETLLYEQHLMIPVFQAANNDPKWKAISEYISGVMGNLLIFHEMGHYYRRHLSGTYEEVIAQNEKAAAPVIEYITANFPERFNEEVRCDLMAVFSIVLACKEDEIAIIAALRACVLGYNVFAVLWSLEKSAVATTNAQRQVPDDITFQTIEKSSAEYTFMVGEDRDMIQRAKMVNFLCEQIAADRNIPLYGMEGDFPLPENSLGDLLSYLDHIMEHDDVNQRNMARLMAESLHGHQDGLDYLYLHSKVFKAPRPISL